MEIERKFLVRSFPPKFKARRGRRIRQGYFPSGRKDLEIRLRQANSRHLLTIKAGRGLTRLEEEVPISKQGFETLWPLVRHASVFKTRYDIPYAGQKVELDVYEGRHRGLVIAEVEFPSVRESRAFEPPQWFGAEVSGNPRYTNASLARRKRP
jgi:CYTH domain-containing protein